MNVYFPMDTLLPLPWSQYASSGGKPYYFNSETQETRFEPPPGAVQLTGRPQAPLPSPARSFPAPPLVVSHDVVKLTTSAGAAVAEGYTLENFGQDTESRQRSVLFHLRQLNNWVKSTLIQEFSKRPCNDVMDMACGKFGDLRKWVKVGVKRIAGLDISRKQLSDAVGRLMEYNHPSDGRPPPAVPIGVKMVLVDASFLNLGPTGVFGPSERFDVISVQFALHYMFETEASALTFFRNIGDRLMPGGVFMGTIADGNILIRNLRNLPNAEDCEFGNSLYRVRFYPESKARQWRMGQYPFGIKYNFHLKVRACVSLCRVSACV